MCSTRHLLNTIRRAAQGFLDVHAKEGVGIRALSTAAAACMRQVVVVVGEAIVVRVTLFAAAQNVGHA